MTAGEAGRGCGAMAQRAGKAVPGGERRVALGWLVSVVQEEVGHRVSLSKDDETKTGTRRRAGAGRYGRAGQAPAGTTSAGGAWWKRGSQPSDFGSHQFRSPRSFIVAGSSTPRMIVASMRTAAARPTPICLNIRNESVANTANTPTMTIAALVIVP